MCTIVSVYPSFYTFIDYFCNFNVTTKMFVDLCNQPTKPTPALSSFFSFRMFKPLAAIAPWILGCHMTTSRPGRTA